MRGTLSDSDCCWARMGLAATINSGEMGTNQYCFFFKAAASDMLSDNTPDRKSRSGHGRNTEKACGSWIPPPPP
eukprot:9473173-Pyramimonas_sp.AAC.1